MKSLAIATGAAVLGSHLASAQPSADVRVASSREAAMRFQQELSVRVGRTALRVRSAANAPDDEERVVLEDLMAGRRVIHP